MIECKLCEIKASEMDDSIFELFKEGLLTEKQRYHCDKKLQRWTIKKNIKWHKKIRINKE